jgi:hypothetical protein
MEGREGRGGNIFIYLCLVQFLGGEGMREEGSKIPYKPTFCFPPNWGDLEGSGGELFIIPKLSLLQLLLLG